MTHPSLPEPSPTPSPSPERQASLESQNAALRRGLRLYRDGQADAGALASFLLEHPDPAALALEQYEAQQKRVLDAVQAFLAAPDRDDTSKMDREMERLLRMRGMGSRPATPVKDARGSRRRR